MEHGNITNSVNFPSVYMEPSDGYRIGVVNSNVPNMLGQMSTAVANEGLNIIDMLNKSRNDLAYTLVDVDQPVKPTLIDKIKQIQGILSVRTIPNNNNDDEQ
jgi:D-3-phosphoglycerate dehydrogenase